MSDEKIERRVPGTIKEKGQYIMVFGIIASMLLVAQIPVFVVFFFGVFAFFALKMFSSSWRNETREIFEFYLSANEILRDDERKWFGFEISDAINKGEMIKRNMSAVPPLVHFALGALYHKIEDHKAAIKHLSHVAEGKNTDELSYVYPTPELRHYVKILRKIERDPAEAPLTSAAIRSLERARRVRGSALLEESRKKYAENAPISEEEFQLAAGNENSSVAGNGDVDADPGLHWIESAAQANERDEEGATRDRSRRSSSKAKKDQIDGFGDRKPISEVLHDIYDKNVN
jgi:hypothetical protein